MMKLRMAVGRCCCGPPVTGSTVEHFYVWQDNALSAGLALISHDGFYTGQCTAATLATIDESPTHSSHNLTVDVGLQNDYRLSEWAMSSAGGDDVYFWQCGQNVDLEAFTVYQYRLESLTADWAYDLETVWDSVASDRSQYPSVPPRVYAPNIGHSSSLYFPLAGHEWTDTDTGKRGSLRLLVGGITPQIVDAVRANVHWDGQETPDFIAAGGGNLAAARNYFVQTRLGLEEISRSFAGVPIYDDLHNDAIYLCYGDVWLTPVLEDFTAFGDMAWWAPTYFNAFIMRWNSVAADIVNVPSWVLNYNDLTVNDATYGTLIASTWTEATPGYVPADFNDSIVAEHQFCLSEDGDRIFTVVAMLDESTLPAPTDVSVNIRTCLVLLAIDTATGTIADHLVLDETSTTTTFAALPSVGSIGKMKGGPGNTVIFNRDEWPTPSAGLGLYCYSSACLELWNLTTDSPYYLTHDGVVYVQGHPDEATPGGSDFFNPSIVSSCSAVTGAKITDYSGELANTAAYIESIDGPIHLR